MVYIVKNNPPGQLLERQVGKFYTPNAAHIFADFSSISALKLAQLGVALDFEENLVPS